MKKREYDEYINHHYKGPKPDHIGHGKKRFADENNNDSYDNNISGSDYNKRNHDRVRSPSPPQANTSNSRKQREKVRSPSPPPNNRDNSRRERNRSPSPVSNGGGNNRRRYHNDENDELSKMVKNTNKDNNNNNKRNSNTNNVPISSKGRNTAKDNDSDDDNYSPNGDGSKRYSNGSSNGHHDKVVSAQEYDELTQLCNKLMLKQVELEDKILRQQDIIEVLFIYTYT